MKFLPLTLHQLSDPALRKVFKQGILLTFVVYALVHLGLWILFQQQEIADGWLGTIIGILGGAAATALSFYLFPAVTGFVLSFLLEDAVKAVEGKHYPYLPAPRTLSIRENLSTAVRFMLVIIGLNTLMLPIYFIPVLNVICFYLLNGYILGREYFELVALRRLSYPEVKEWRWRYRLLLLGIGVIIALLLTIPLLNLAIPVLSVAYMTHVLEMLRNRVNKL